MVFRVTLNRGSNGSSYSSMVGRGGWWLRRGSMKGARLEPPRRPFLTSLGRGSVERQGTGGEGSAPNLVRHTPPKTVNLFGTGKELRVNGGIEVRGWSTRPPSPRNFGGLEELVVRRHLVTTSSHVILDEGTGTYQARHHGSGRSIAESSTLVNRVVDLVVTRDLDQAHHLCQHHSDSQLPEYHLKLLTGVVLARREGPESVKLWFNHCRIPFGVTKATSVPFATLWVNQVLASLAPESHEWLSIVEAESPLWTDPQLIILFSYISSLRRKAEVPSPNSEDPELQGLILKWQRVAKSITDIVVFPNWGQMVTITHCYQATALALKKPEYLWMALDWLKTLGCSGVDLSHPQIFVALMEGFEKLPSETSPSQLVRTDALEGCRTTLKLMRQVGCRFTKSSQLLPLIDASFPTNLPAPSDLLQFDYPTQSRHYDSFPSRDQIALIEAEMLHDQLVYDQVTCHRMLALLSLVPYLKSDFIRRWNSMHHTIHIPPSQGSYYLLFISQQRSSEDARKAVNIFLPKLLRERSTLGPLDSKLIHAIFGALEVSQDPSCFVRCFRFARDVIGVENLTPEVLTSLMNSVTANSEFDCQQQLLEIIDQFIDGSPSTLQYYQLKLDYYANTHQAHAALHHFSSFIPNFYPILPFQLQWINDTLLDLVPSEGVHIPSEVVLALASCIRALLNEKRVGQAGRMLRQYGLATFHPPSVSFFDHDHVQRHPYFPTPVALAIFERALAHHKFIHYTTIDSTLPSLEVDPATSDLLRRFEAVPPHQAIDLGMGYDGLRLAQWVSTDFLPRTVDLCRFYRFLSCFPRLNPPSPA